jgi:NTE family protein
VASRIRLSRRVPRWAAAFVAGALASALGVASAQPVTGGQVRKPEGRPKVCVVLSGGGARGAAHIGVLKVLEELRVPVDCITGTSMGSLVGGAYASGMSVPEMEKVAEALRSDLLFNDKPPRQEETVRRKEDDASILFGLELGVRDRELLLQKGVVSGIQLEAVLRRLSKVKQTVSFDDLPIPFRAVATDLVTGTPVVFDGGDLPRVMRASMSVPGVIAPAQIGDMILVDGGLTNNLPVDVARAMGADIVIAVNLGTPLMTREQLGSVLGVTGQMINILTEQNVRTSLASLKPTDILIEPALGNFSAGDFDHLTKTLPIGEAAARKVAARLSELSLSPTAYAELRARQVAPPEAPPQVVADIRFPGLERVNPDALLDFLDTRPGEVLDTDRLDRDLRRLYGSGDFEHVDYQLIEEAGKQIVSIHAIEKSWGPNYLRFGLGLQTDFKGENAFNLAVSYRKTWVNPLGAEWRTDLQMGQVSYLSTEFYQPLGARNGLFIAPRATVLRRSLDLFQGDQRIARYNLRSAYGALDIGAAFTRYGEVRLGVVSGRTSASLDTGAPEFEPNPSSVPRGGYTFRAFVDQLDSANFPRGGFGASLDVFASSTSIGARDNYTRWDLNAVGAYTWGRHTLMPAIRFAGAATGDTLPVYDLAQWGGFLQQSGLPSGALLGQQLEFGRLVYLYKLAELKLIPGIYFGASAEVGRMKQPLVPGNFTGTLFSSAILFGADTPVGPLYIGYGLMNGGYRSAYLFLGHP